MRPCLALAPSIRRVAPASSVRSPVTVSALPPLLAIPAVTRASASASMSPSTTAGAFGRKTLGNRPADAVRRSSQPRPHSRAVPWDLLRFVRCASSIAAVFSNGQGRASRKIRWSTRTHGENKVRAASPGGWWRVKITAGSYWLIVARLERRCRELRSDAHRVGSAPFPSSYSKERMREIVQTWAQQGAPNVSALIEHEHGEIAWPMRTLQSRVFNAEGPRPNAFAEIEAVIPTLA
jgi:hypothetical protein